MRAFVLVEGVSDQVALETLAGRRGRDLEAEGVRVVPIGGAQAVGRVLAQLTGEDVAIVGLCDEAEAPSFERGFARAGLDGGFAVCVTDLEDELIRALGVEVVEEIAREHGELGRFRTFQKQPAQQGKTLEQQLHRWMINRKIRYARFLVEALDLAAVPRPLDAVLARV